MEKENKCCDEHICSCTKCDCSNNCCKECCDCCKDTNCCS